MKVFTSIFATEDAATHAAAYTGGTVREVLKREKDLTFSSMWEVSTISHPGIPEQRHSTPVESTRVEETSEPAPKGPRQVTLVDGRTIPTRGYCAPLRCYCTDPACPATRTGAYTTDDLLALARRESGRLRREHGFIEEVPPQVRKRAFRIYQEGAPPEYGCQPHLTKGYVPPNPQYGEAMSEVTTEGMTVSSRTKRQVVRRA